MASTTDDIFTPDFKTSPYWWEAAPPETASDPLPAKADVVVVGSGFAGLNAAIELARHGKNVVVLDANELGSGGSTRTGGMISSGQKLVVGGAIKGISAELFSRMIADSIASYAFIQELVKNERLDADLFIGGRYFGAHTKKQLDSLYQMGDILHKVTGVTVHKVKRKEQASIIGSEFYHGGILVDEYGGVHPGKYNKALRDLARQLGASLYSHARVTSVTPRNGLKIVATERGVIEAQEVLVLTNGYTDSVATPNLAKRIVPVKSYQIATEPLPPELMAKLIPGGRMITDSRRDLIYTRPSPDGTRLLFGSRPGIMDCDDKTAAVRIRERMLAIWPELKNYRISHAWSGYVGMTHDKTAYAGLMDSTRFAVGCNGNGVALMSWLGYRTAQKVLGTEARPLSFDRPGFRRIPLYDGRPWFVPFVSGWYRLRDAVDKQLD